MARYRCTGSKKNNCDKDPCIIILPDVVDTVPDPVCIWEHIRKEGNPKVLWLKVNEEGELI